MTMKTKHKKQRSKLKSVIILSSLGLLVVAGIGIYFYSVSRNKEPAAESRTPLFSFDKKKAPGWYQSALDTSTQESRRSILLFDHDMSAPPRQSCHVSAFLNSGTVDIKAKRKELENDKFGHTTTLRGTKALSLSTSSGAEQYELYQYQTKAPKGATPIKEGYAYGYVQLEDHFIELQAVCDTPKQLKKAIPAFQAILYNDNASKE